MEQVSKRNPNFGTGGKKNTNFGAGGTKIPPPPYFLME